jgi:protein ImuB
MSGTRGSARRVLVLRCPDWLTGEEPESAAAARAFEPVVAIVAEFCPQVEVLRPGLVAIAARGPSRYFGGEAALAARLAEAVSSGGQHGGGLRGITCQVGIADGLFAADLAAQAGPGLLIPPGETPQFLAGLPVAALPCADLGVPELADLLPRLGIRTLGEFAALPAAEAGSRFGAQGTVAHRLARGLDPRPLAPQPPRRDLSVEQAFDPPADQSEPVVFTAKALAERMHARLAAHGLVCVRVQVQVCCADGQEFTRLWRHDGLLSALAVAERVRWQLDGWRGGSGRDPGTGREPGTSRDQEAGGITLLRLVPDQLVRATGHQLALWGDAVVSDRVARAAIRVQAMLGHTAVTRPVLSGGRSPAEQILLAPFGDAAVPQRPADRPWPGQIPAPAPAIVYPEPQPASVTDAAGREVSVSGRAQLSAPPAWLSAGRGQARAVICWAGPWPVTERWWDPARTRRQARFQLVTDDGSAWLAVLQDGRWQLEAQYG